MVHHARHQLLPSVEDMVALVVSVELHPVDTAGQRPSPPLVGTVVKDPSAEASQAVPPVTEQLPLR